MSPTLGAARRGPRPPRSQRAFRECGNNSRVGRVPMGDMSSQVREEPMTTTYAAAGGEAPAAAWVPPTWEEVVEQHSARVYRLAYRLTGNVHDAEDLTQDVFVRVFRSLHTYQPGTFE